MPSSGLELVAYTQANATTGAANAATYAVSLGAANTSTVNVTGNWQVDLAGSPAGSLSALDAADAAAAGSLAPSTFVLPNRQIDFGPGNFALDANVSLSGTLALEGAGSVTQPSGEITAGSLLLAGGSFALGSANNSVGTLAAAVAKFEFDGRSDADRRDGGGLKQCRHRGRNLVRDGEPDLDQRRDHARISNQRP